MGGTRGFKSVTAKLSKMAKDLKTEPQKTAVRQSKKVAQEARTIVLFNDTYASGELYAGIGTETSKIPGGLRVKIVSNAPHSGYVEYGTGSYNLPTGPRYAASDMSHSLVMAILQWMMVKPTFTLTPTYYRAYTIAKAIAEGTGRRGRGTPAQPFMNPAWYNNELRFKKAVINSAKRATRV